MIYFIVTASLFNDCSIRKNQYITGINKLKQIVKALNIENYKIIIVENNGTRPTFLDTLDCEVYYTKNNFLNKEKGYIELQDVLDCIDKFNIKDTDFIVKMTGRYVLTDNSEFMDIIKNIHNTKYDCVIKYGSFFAPVKYKIEDCSTGLIGMVCYYVKQIEKPNDNECVEWKWAKATYLMDDAKIFISNNLGINYWPTDPGYPGCYLV